MLKMYLIFIHLLFYGYILTIFYMFWFFNQTIGFIVWVMWNICAEWVTFLIFICLSKRTKRETKKFSYNDLQK